MSENGKNTSSGRRRAAKIPIPAEDDDRGRDPEDGGEDRPLDKRESARQTAKPRSARESLKGPNNRKGAAARKKGQ
jgi:hypothetical protein